MARRVVQFAAAAAARGLITAANAALGYPADATQRGSACPPPPFGRTERWSWLWQRLDGNYFVIAPPTGSGVSHPPDRETDAGDEGAVPIE